MHNMVPVIVLCKCILTWIESNRIEINQIGWNSIELKQAWTNLESAIMHNNLILLYWIKITLSTKNKITPFMKKSFLLIVYEDL